MGDRPWTKCRLCRLDWRNGSYQAWPLLLPKTASLCNGTVYGDNQRASSTFWLRSSIVLSTNSLFHGYASRWTGASCV
jgi:hypothetical protein